MHSFDSLSKHSFLTNFPVTFSPASRISDAGIKEASKSQSEPPSDPEDPWASLQAQYKIQGENHGNTAKRLVNKQRAGDNDEDEDEVIVIDEGHNSDDELQDTRSKSSTVRGSRATSQQRITPPPMPIVNSNVIKGPPQKGSWGQGDLASAGTLMLGEEKPLQSLKNAPPQRSRLPPLTAKPEDPRDSDEFQAVLEVGGMVGGVSGVGMGMPGCVAGDLGMEDVEDLDLLIDEEMNILGVNAGLASKLAQFESLDPDI
jgi:hypothetical protein